jgi:hypothetical protein
VRLGGARFHEVRYEDLVEDPERELRAICRFADLEYTDGMLEYHRRADELLDGLRHTGHIQGVRRPPTARVRDWRTTLSTRQLELFEAAAGDALDAYGYERTGIQPSARAVVEAQAWRLATDLERQTRILRTRVLRRVRNPNGMRAES